MKKTALLIMIALMAALMLVGCGPKADTQTITAKILEVTEGSFFVQPTAGLDGIESIYLNKNDDTVIDVDETLLVPGAVITAEIGNEIMESFPPQVVLYKITDATAAPDDAAGGDTTLMNDDYVIGKLKSIAGDQYTIDVVSANLYDGEMTITIPSDVLSDDMPMVEGYLVGINIVADGETYTAQSIVFSEPDAVIELDDRERISGFLDGMFPSAVYGGGDESITAQVDTPFAIGLAEPNDSPWTLTPQDHITLVADGTDANDLPDDMGTDTMATHYFGISADAAGEYTLVFTRPDVSGGDNVTLTIALTVE
jgi:hypothetical protein